MVGINPESKRNSNVGLLPFKDGLAVLIAKNLSVKVLPIGFVYDEVTKTVEIRVGEPFVPSLEMNSGVGVDDASGLVSKDTIAEIAAVCRAKLESLLDSSTES